METKTCSKCKTEQPVCNYYKNCRLKDKLHPACKSCDIKRLNERNKDNIKIRVKIDESNVITTKLCNKCNNLKNMSEFGKGIKYIHNTCIECIRNKKMLSVSNVFKKICTSCNIEKDNLYFTKRVKSKDGFSGKCYECEYIVKTKKEENKIRDERYLENKIKQCSDCKEEKAFSEFINDIHCKFGLKSKCKVCVQKIRRTYIRNRTNNSTVFRLENNLRSRLCRAICQKRNGGAVKSAKTIELLGADIETVYKHLEEQFKEGMTWENYGKWHVDHILPCASFDLSIPEEQFKCFNYKNLQPLWAIDNLRKQAKILQ